MTHLARYIASVTAAAALLTWSAPLWAAGEQVAPAAAKPPKRSAKQEAQIKRGEYLATLGLCNDCHTPFAFDKELGMPVPDMKRMLSGHPEGAADPKPVPSTSDEMVFAGVGTAIGSAMGVVYAANLTPDTDTGLGSWTEEIFIRAIRTGKHMGGQGRPILPPMPWASLGKATDEDLRAVWAYLRSIPAVRNAVPAPKVPEAAMIELDKAYKRMAAPATPQANKK
jgi:hypothetical protein